MPRIKVAPRAVLPDGSVMCCDYPIVGDDDVCSTCQCIHIWDDDGVHFEVDIPLVIP